MKFYLGRPWSDRVSRPYRRHLKHCLIRRSAYLPFRDVPLSQGPIYSSPSEPEQPLRRVQVVRFLEGSAMRDPLAVLRAKEQEIVRIKKEIEALRVAARLLREEGDEIPEDLKPDLRRVIPMP